MPYTKKIKKHQTNELLNPTITEIRALYDIIIIDTAEGNFTTSLEQHYLELDIISQPNDPPTFDVDNNMINGLEMNDLKHEKDLILALNHTKIDLENGNYTIETSEEHIERLWSEK